MKGTPFQCGIGGLFDPQHRVMMGIILIMTILAARAKVRV